MTEEKKDWPDFLAAVVLLVPAFPALPFYFAGLHMGKAGFFRKLPKALYILLMAPPCLIGLFWPGAFVFAWLIGLVGGSGPDSVVRFWSFAVWSPLWLAGIPAGILFHKISGYKWLPAAAILLVQALSLMPAIPYLVNVD